MLTLDPSPNYSKFMREYILKQFEWFHATISEVIETQVINLPLIKNDSILDAIELVATYNFKISSAFLFILSYDRGHGQYLFKEICSNKAFKVIEIELGFLYDVLYTKATIIHSSQDWAFCIFNFSFTSYHW